MSRISTFPNREHSRPPSEHLVDLHVYKVPLDLWRMPLNNILNQAVTDTISLGIIRVPPDIHLIDIRAEISRQLEELAPKDYVFLRSVGRSITRLKGKQEYRLKAKHFLPPVHYAPELFLLEATPEIRDALAISDRSSQESPNSLHRGSPGSRTYRDGYRSYRQRNGYPDYDSRRQSPSPVRRGDAGKAYRGANGFEREAAYTDNTNEDSGVAGLSPEDQYKNRDKENVYDTKNRKAREQKSDEDEEERQRLREEEEERARLERERWAKEEEERRRKAEEDWRRREEERKLEEARRRAQEEEEERRRREEEKERRRREEEEERRRREEEEERRRREEEEEEERRRREEEDRCHQDFHHSPCSSPEPDHHSDTASARQRRREEEKRLLRELEVARGARHNTEKEREDLVKKAKNLQIKTQNKRNLARDLWKKRYFEEKKKTAPLEDQTNRLRDELEALHRRLMTTLEGPKEKNLKMGDKRPSQKNNYVIQCTRLKHDIDELRRRVENAKMKLTAEMKLRTQAESELRAVRAEAVQKKINMRGQAFQVY